MKTLAYILLCILFIVVLSGCEDEAQDPVSETMSLSDSSADNAFAIEYMDISEQFITGQMIGAEPANVGLKEENIFMQDNTMTGIDYVSLCGMNGNVVCYMDNGKISSCNFGSEAFTDPVEFNEQLISMNQQLAEKLGVEPAELTFTGFSGSEDADELKNVFDGNGTVRAEYQRNSCRITLIGMGVNQAATIVVELQPAEAETE